MKLCLGTVQFGMKYGIGNQAGQPSEEECFGMLDLALEKGVQAIDTARAYGTAELVVGNYLDYRKCHEQVEIISKLRPNVIDWDEKDVSSAVRRELEDSLKRLRVSYLNGYLLHTPEYVYREEIVQALFRLKEEKLIQNVGVSVYHMEEGYEAIKKQMDYVQLPYSILDQRGMRDGFIRQAREAGMTVFTRSAFLQGLLMMDLDKIPGGLEHSRPYLESFHALAKKYKKPETELLLQFVKASTEIDYLVFGVDNKEQLMEDMKLFDTERLMEGEILQDIQKSYSQAEDSIILPSLWSDGRKAE